jgi:hypothetical protein
MGTAAHADVVGSAPAFGGATQAAVVCTYSNLSRNDVNIVSSVILEHPGVKVPEQAEDCTGAIPAGGWCRTFANAIKPSHAYWCRANFANKKPIRGRMELRDSSGVVLTAEEIR